MVTIQKTNLKESILKGVEKAKKSSASILVSAVQKIEYMNPLSFFSAGMKRYQGERFFWKHSTEEFYIVGLGICKRIVTDQAADRFFHVEKEWKHLIQSAIISESENIQGTGPTAFGCFSFDPLKEKTELWAKFSHSIFNIPKYMLTMVDHQVYLTTNIICTEQDDPTIVAKIEQEIQEILRVASVPLHPFENNSLKKRIDIKPEEWKAQVTKVAHELKEDSLKKVVLARESRLVFTKRIVTEQVLSSLLSEQHDSFIFAFEQSSDCFIGATPERLVKKEYDHIFSACLAGSIARGNTKEEDILLGDSLINDKKNLTEHQYVVDMIQDAMEETCAEVIIPDHPRLFKLKNIQHLYTPVIGKANQETSLLTLVERLHPTPALGGLPKKEAIDKIREVEALDRGLYGSPVGWLDHQGNGDFAVSIRSGLIQGNEASIFAGCGVVQDSIAELEFEETNIKFKPMLSALGGLKG